MSSINFLRHAGIFTAEEVIYISREKLFRMQTLYIGQFRRLQYLLKEKKRNYIHALKKEKEIYGELHKRTLLVEDYFGTFENMNTFVAGNIHDQPRESEKEKKIYEKLKALNRYHKRNGVEAVLYKKSIERRTLVSEIIYFFP